MSRTRARAGQRRGVPKRGLVVFSSTNTCPPAFLPTLRHSAFPLASWRRRCVARSTRRAALRDAELVEDAKLRVEHAAQVERLHRSVCTAALGVRGREEVRNVAATTARGERAISTRRVRRAPDPSHPSHPVHSPLPPRSPSRRFPLACTRLSQLAKVKIAQGEYAAAWDARNAATQLREAERAEANPP